MSGSAAVTGASRGIGRATTLALARAGYRVFALARTAGDLQALAREGNGNIVPVVMDIADDESRRRAVETIMAATDDYGLDVLVNNAGYGQLGPLEEVSPDKLRYQLEVNVVGLMALTQPFLPGMRERGSGRIVNVSSAAGRVASPFMGAYSASKFALEAMSDSLRYELAPFGVAVILVEPGPIRTEWGDVAERMRVRREDSPYEGLLRRWHRTHGAGGIFKQSAESVARVVLRAVESSRPRARYTVTLEAKGATVARRLVPDFVMDWAFRLMLGSRG